jgi:hypothetical protein
MLLLSFTLISLKPFLVFLLTSFRISICVWIYLLVPKFYLL